MLCVSYFIPYIEPETVASYLLTAAKFILTGYSVDVVVVGQVTIRQHEPYSGYNEKVLATNAILREKITQEGNCNIQFATLRMEPNPLMFLPDGIHFSQTGNRRYWQGVRGAFIWALTFISTC